MASLARLLQIVRIVCQHLLALWVGRVLWRVTWLRPWLPMQELSKPQRLRFALESLGGAFVKLGQMMALQPDILPFEYCHELYNLLDRVHPVPFDQIEPVFCSEIDKRPEEIFDSFDRTSIASGSIGQVHVATFQGKKVAVKIQRPDTKFGFERDVRLMKTAVWLIDRLHLVPIAWLIDPLTEFAEWTVEELDFRREARYMKQLRQNATGNAQERVPAVLPALCTRRVLVVEFLEAVSVLDHMRHLEKNNEHHQERLARIGFDGHAFAESIIDNFLADAFVHGMFHADLHPANLMIMPNNAVGYVDFGITGVLSPFSRRKLIAMTLAYANRSTETLCARFFDVASIDERSDPACFRRGVSRLAEKWYAGGEDNPVLKTTTTMVMLDMLKLSRQARIWPQRDVIKYIRSAIAIDGLIRQFAPQFDVNHHLATACRRHLAWHARQSLLSHDALVGWSKAMADLTQTGAFRVSSFFERVAAARDQGPPHISNAAAPAMVRATAWKMLAGGGVIALLGLTTNPSFALGGNLFTAQMIVAAGACIAALRGFLHSTVARA